MAIIKKGRCPPFTTSNTNGECVYYDPDKPNMAYDYNGEDISLLTTPAPFGGPPLAVYISNSCTTTPNTFQDNMDLYHACEEWYLQSVGDPENPHRRRQRRRRRLRQHRRRRVMTGLDLRPPSRRRSLTILLRRASLLSYLTNSHQRLVS